MKLLRHFRKKRALERLTLAAQQPIIWTGNLDDDCQAIWAGLMLRAEWMHGKIWWWAVYEIAHDYETIDSENEHRTRIIGGETARAYAERAARKFIQKQLQILSN
ncbi:hypothetical protein ACTHGU_20510 [Chitinophagaceae bacterium MMS25-I14]